MRAKVVVNDFDMGEAYFIVISKDLARKLDICPGCRVTLIVNDRRLTAIAGITDRLESTVVMPRSLYESLGCPKEVDVEPYLIPHSILFIKKKLRGGKLSYEEVFKIIKDVVDGVLTDVEIAAFISAQMSIGMDIQEMAYLTKAMVETGRKLRFDEPVYDIHSIGGVPGNSKVSIVAVPIIASAGIFIPKTSSRAITSPAGTADTMGVLARVEYTEEEVLELAKKVNGFIIWGVH